MSVPNIIAGPILRRVEKNKVSVWVACSKNYHCTLNIYEGDGVKLGASGDSESSTGAQLVETSKNETPAVQFGKNLWIALITAEVSGLGLQAGKIYSYNVVIENMQESHDKGDLRTEGFLKDGEHLERPQKALGYKENVLPSFALPSDKPEYLFIAQASCRKMHGYGEDALSYLDKVIEDFGKDTEPQIKKRPQQLFLTGDQIYADDVAGMLLRYGSTLDGTSLVGEEKVQIRMNNGSPVEELSAEHVTFPVYLRQHLVNEYGGLTSDSASCHLISFEEFAGTYLNYWSIRS